MKYILELAGGIYWRIIEMPNSIKTKHKSNKHFNCRSSIKKQEDIPTAIPRTNAQQAGISIGGGGIAS